MRPSLIALAGVFLLLPALHPLLLPVVGVPSHLLWFAHALPVALLAYACGFRGAVPALLGSAAWVASGEVLFGAGYGVPADAATILALSVAVFLTNVLVAGFALAVRAEQARRRGQEQLVGAALRASPEAVVLVDEALQIQYANAAAHQLFDAPGEQLAGMAFRALVSGDEESLDVYREGQGRLQVAAQTVHGTPFAAELSCSPVRDGEGKPVACLVTVRNMSERLRRELVDRRTQSLSELGAAIASIAHELNNPLAALVMGAELLRDSAAPHEADDLDTVIHEARRASGIARQLLHLVRRGEQVREAVDLCAVVSRVLKGRSASFAAHGIQVVFEPRAPSAMVAVVPGQIEQVLINLFANAEQAMHAANGRGRLRVELEVVDDEALVKVRDDGPGIPPEHQSRLFEAFYTTKPVGVGTGLGLSIARRIAREHGGDLVAASVPGQGATFTLRLPTGKDRGADREPTHPAAPAEATRQRVLVVDDEPSLLRSLERLLQRRGMKVVGASSAAEALRALDGVAFDTVLCDVHLRGASGIDLYRQVVRHRPELRHRFVFMTGDVLSVELREFFDASGSRHVAKPFEFAELLSVVERSAA